MSKITDSLNNYWRVVSLPIKHTAETAMSIAMANSNSNVTVTAEDMVLVGYTNADDRTAISASDNVLLALAKLEARINELYDRTEAATTAEINAIISGNYGDA